MCKSVSRDIRRNPVELIEPVMMSQPHRFALHFEKPAVLDRPGAKRTIRHHGARAFFALRLGDAIARRPKLHDEAFQCLADTTER